VLLGVVIVASFLTGGCAVFGGGGCLGETSAFVDAVTADPFYVSAQIRFGASENHQFSSCDSSEGIPGLDVRWPTVRPVESRPILEREALAAGWRARPDDGCWTKALAGQPAAFILDDPMLVGTHVQFRPTAGAEPCGVYPD